jgi:hypothetical protein
MFGGLQLLVQLFTNSHVSLHFIEMNDIRSVLWQFIF